jgi:hypothetical protein
MMRRLILLSLLLVACTVPFGELPNATPLPPSGIVGTVILGPTCPVESEPGAYDPVPCLTPYAAQLVVLDANNSVAARVSSTDDGSFRVDLPPGDYVITPLGGDPFPIAQPLNVRVTVGEYVAVQVNYDTGIR